MTEPAQAAQSAPAAAAAAAESDARDRARSRCDPEQYRVPTGPAIPLAYLPTGVAQVDSALPGGGLPLQRVVEVVGPPASGKTTLCCTASAQAAADGSVLFVETRGADVAERLQQIASAANAAQVLDNVRVADVHTMDELLLLLGELLEQGGLRAGVGGAQLPLRLLVVDCFADLANSRVHAHPRETGLVCATTRLLAQVAQQLGSCVLTTNTTVRGDGAELHKAALKATAGPSAPQLRVLVSCTEGLRAQVVDSVDHPAAFARCTT